MSYNYWCENRDNVESCDLCNKHGDLVIDSETVLRIKKEKNIFVCKHTSEIELKQMGQNSASIIGKHKTREKEGRKRSVDHFKKEIYPTLDRGERKGFAKKHNLKE